MFTGIITHLGKVKEKSSKDLIIHADPKLLSQLNNGMSVSVNGICLTVVSFDNTSFTINYMPETAQKTSIGEMEVEDLVNLEMPATPNSMLAGHIVQGHVDTVGKIVSIQEEGNSRIFTFSIPKEISKYIVEKGSIAVNGISLTVIHVTDDSFTVGIIPHTWEKTMLHRAKPNDHVNIEVDVFAKYLEKLVSKRK